MLQRKMVVFLDSQSAIHLSKNPIYHKRTKYIDAKYHYIRDLVANGTVIILKVPTENNLLDMGTNVLSATNFKHYLDLLHMGIG